MFWQFCLNLLFWLQTQIMNDNVRVGRQSLTKKISFHEKQSRPYKTIQSLEKQPTKKKMTLTNYQLKKDSHPILHNSSQLQQDRKNKSNNKYEVNKLGESHKKRSGLGSEPELATIEGLIRGNMQGIKFSVSRDRERLMTRQKYKRSEQVRSLMQNKKMSSITKLQRKDTGHSNKLSHICRSIDRDQNSSKPIRTNKQQFKQLNLGSVISPVESKTTDCTLQDIFNQGCAIYNNYLSTKEQKLTKSNGYKTMHLKDLREEMNLQLEQAKSKFNIILNEVGELSIKNLFMISLIDFEQGKFNEVIMYLGKVMQKTDGNLFLLKLPGNFMLDQTGNSQQYDKDLMLNFIGYLYLAESYKATNNYLCAVNVLLKWESQCKLTLSQKNQSISLKQHYQTLQPKESNDQKIDFKHGQRMKKKSYLLSALQPEQTTNKFKKYSHTHNYSSIELSKSNNRPQNSERPKLQEFSIKDKDHLPILNQETDMVSKVYSKETTNIYLLLSRLYTKIKSYDLAINYYLKCLTNNPVKLQAMLELASIYYVKYSSKKSLQWLQTCLKRIQGEQQKGSGWQMDRSYIVYHTCLILFQQKRLQQSYQLFCTISIQQLSSEVNYYKGLIKLSQMQLQQSLSTVQRNIQIQSVLMFYNQSISAFTSKEYLIKSYFQIILILVLQKKDYYGAQYEVDRFKKIVPNKHDTQKDETHIGFSRISKIYEQEEGPDKEQNSVNAGVWNKDSHINLLFQIIEAVICILKMKINKGINKFKQISLKVQTHSQQIYRHYGCYYKQIVKLLFQFKFYAYYILRQYELALKHVNKLIQIMNQENNQQLSMNQSVEFKLIHINKLMLECMILMKQHKFNYAMSKLNQIQALLNQSAQLNQQQTQSINCALILNNYNMVKSLCYINLYSQLEKERQVEQIQPENGQQNNKQILLSAEELLRHCLISDKENSLIYYLISVIHYQLQEYESSLKYIREALQFSDDHMIKHYFNKANTKLMLGRYEEAIKDYTNAIIVYKEQLKNEGKEVKEQNTKKANTKEIKEGDEDYYQEKQAMFNQIYLNRAIAYLKLCYQLAQSKDYGNHCTTISSYRTKAGEDLLKYFGNIVESNTENKDQQELKNRILLLLHTDDPSYLLDINKQFAPKYQLVKQEDVIKVYYLIKELNNCIINLRNYIQLQEHKITKKEQSKVKKDHIPPKHKKISIALPKLTTETAQQMKKLNQFKFDLRCLQALKKSSSKSQGALEDSLISLLQITQQIYKKREEQLSSMAGEGNNYTLQQLFTGSCGQIFKWSDILFFIGVIHFQLKQYETAIKYFQQSYNEKKANGTLYSLAKYLNPIVKKCNGGEQFDDQQFMFSQVEPLFQNRIYCKQELDYNLGICYLLLKKYKQAYYYLQNYPNFLFIIKKAITVQTLQENQFITNSNRSHDKNNQILISDISNSQHVLKQFELRKESKQNIINLQKLTQNSRSLSAISKKVSQEQDRFHNITPFPTHNRLCSIYSPKIIEDNKFYLSFCLPKVQLPLLHLFHDEQVEAGRKMVESGNVSDCDSQQSQMKDLSQSEINQFKMQKRGVDSIINHVSLIDLQMKPIAPWIRQNTCGVIFTQNIINQSVDLNSERIEKRKEKLIDDHKDEPAKRNKKERYAGCESQK